jgi:hypothetical protein
MARRMFHALLTVVALGTLIYTIGAPVIHGP